MDVSLSPEIEKFIQDKIASGEYESVSAVIESALNHFRAQDLLSAPEYRNSEELEELRREIRIGIDQANRKEFIPMEEAFRILDERIRDKQSHSS